LTLKQHSCERVLMQATEIERGNMKTEVGEDDGEDATNQDSKFSKKSIRHPTASRRFPR